MKTLSIPNVSAGLLAAVLLGTLLAATGCRTSGEATSLQEGAVCPTCQSAAQVAVIAGVAYSKAVCPHCRSVSTVDPAVADTVRAYVGSEVGDKIHVCDKCKAIVEKCPICRKQAGR